MQPATHPPGPRRFRPGLLWTIAAAAGVAATIALGYWQLGRANEKEHLAATIAQLRLQPPAKVDGNAALTVDSVEHRVIEARGRFEPEHMVLLDNKIRRGATGYEVVMPLRIDGASRRLLVNRGWIAGTGARERMPQVQTPVGEVVVRGRAVVPGRRIYELGEATVEGRVWQNLTTERYSGRTGLQVQPVLLLQENDLADALVRDWPAPDSGVGTHKSYAVQWFALSILIFVTYVLLSFRRDSHHS